MAKSIKEIVPNPLITSTVEIRFTSEKQPGELLSPVYSIFGQKYPKLTDKRLPPDLKSRPEFEFAAEFELSNTDYSVSFANNVIVFENVGGYKLWANYFHEIKECLNIFELLNIVKSVQRVGIRYASLFEINERLGDSLKVNPVLLYPGYDSRDDFFITTFTNKDLNIRLQAIQNAKVVKDNIERTGLYIDIDVFQSNNLPSPLLKGIYQLIDDLHSEEKKLFEHLLKDEFLETLNVKYD